MAQKVFFHIGVPKTGTTYLQSIMWRHAEQLRDAGVLLPAADLSDHRWGSLVIRDDPKLRHRPRRARSSWARILHDVQGWPGTAVISHEFYATASAEQAQRAVDALAPAEVHLVVTARDPLSLLTASWQEVLKYRSVTPLDEFSTEVSDSPHDLWNWRGLDAAEVLGRWGPTVPAERVHVIPARRGRAGGRDLWDRFAGLFADPAAYDADVGVRNQSMGLVECELLRCTTPHLDLGSARAVTTWVRGYLAEQTLVPRSGERFLPGPGRVKECRERGEQMVARLRAAGYDVLGDLDDLRVPDELPPLRTPADVTAEELAAAAAGVIAALVRDRRAADKQQRTAGPEPADGRPTRLRARLGAVGRLVTRSR
jgi:hypothetical protein